MAGKTTDRKNKKSIVDQSETLANFTMPDSLPCSEIEFPILPKKIPKAKWNEILEESDKTLQEIAEYQASKKATIPKAPFQRRLSHQEAQHPLSPLQIDSSDWSTIDLKKSIVDQSETLANFTMPDSLPCSEIEFPILPKKIPKAKWNEILEESDKTLQEIAEYQASKKATIPKAPFQKTECDYISNEVFIYLIPALEETLVKAKMWDALVRQKCFFNGIDHIVELLWNGNPRYPGRQYNPKHVFNIPFVRKHLKEHPRPYYPKSWLWPEEYAATLIQKSVRQYFVQREDEVQEMRDFWRKLEVERLSPDIRSNPYLAKKFACDGQGHREKPEHK